MTEHFGKNTRIWDKFYVCQEHDTVSQIMQG
jgi:hypothetical protein